MADPVSDIEIQLRRSVTPATANDQRAKLNQQFATLSPDESAALLEKILSDDGARLPHDFRRLHRAVRLELILKLAMRLGTQTSERLYTKLTAKSGDPKMQKALHHVFPEGMPALRDKFLKTLHHGPPSGTPTVLLEFRSHNQSRSADNECELETPGQLGLDPDPRSGLNWMEIRGTVTGHRPDDDYRFDRTMEVGNFYLAGKDWKCQDYTPSGKNDNTHRSDEDFHPDNDHIYVVDCPGFTTIPPILANIPFEDRSKVTEYVFMQNSIETVEVKVGKGAWSQAASLQWFSVTWLEIANGTWRRKPGKNKIVKGAIDGMDIAASIGTPPESF